MTEIGKNELVSTYAYMYGIACRKILCKEWPCIIFRALLEATKHYLFNCFLNYACSSF